MNKDDKNIEIDLITRNLAGEANKEEQEYCNRWKDASEENKQLYNELMEVWLAMDKTALNRNINIDDEWNRHTKTFNTSFQPSSKSISLKTVFRIAASILLIVGFSYFGYKHLTKKAIKTEMAQTNEVTLPDGSHVTLNASSKLTYSKNFGNDSRTVTLEGEAFFEVVKNPQSPFIIILNDAEVKVLGTSFNVKAYKETNKIEVTVSEGLVSVYEKGKEYNKTIVAKGEKAVYSKQLNNIQKRPNENRNFIAWKTRLMIFENDDLPLVTRIVSEVYHKKIVLQDPNLSHCTISTIFDNKDLETVLKVLKSTLDITIEEKDGIIFIKGKGC